ncbi:MAG: radical SAM/SPASM domain-containing protein [bacterium]
MQIINKLLERPSLVLGKTIQRQVSFHKIRPNTVTWYLTFRCNSKCTTCTFWTRDKQQLKDGELNLEQLIQIANDLHENGIRNAELFGGNVLLRKDVLIPLLYHLQTLGWTVTIPTNQIGMDAKTIKALVDTEVFILYISTDGIDEYQNEIRGFKGADNLNTKVVRAIRDYRDKSSKKYPRLVCNTTISKYNVDIMEKIPGFALKMGFDSVAYEYAGEMNDEVISSSLIDGLKPTPMFVQQDGQSILASKEQAKEIKRKIKLIKRQYRHAPIEIATENIDDLSEKQLHRGTIPHKQCYVERVEVTVDPYGNIVSCPVIHNNKYGNLLKDDFKTIWNNERHQRFRHLQNCGDLPMCKHCILGVIRNPSFFRSLKRNFMESGVKAFHRFIASKKRGKFNGNHWDKNHMMDSSNGRHELNNQSLLTVGESHES